jgi:hypothetical protein
MPNTVLTATPLEVVVASLEASIGIADRRKKVNV